MTGDPRGRCQRYELEYTNRTGVENLQVLIGDWIEDVAVLVLSRQSEEHQLTTG